MPFVTGSAGDITALRTAIINACTANGWTLAGDVLSKGTAFLRLQVVGTALESLGGTGIDGGNLLTGVAPHVVRVGSWGVSPMQFPATYEIHIHTAPDEVYCLVNYNVTDYQWLAFGLSSVAGMAGTGMWFGATYFNSPLSDEVNLAADGVGTNNNRESVALFHHGFAQRQHFVHHGFDSFSWSVEGALIPGSTLSSLKAVAPLYERSPNSDGDAPLLPLRSYVMRLQNKSALAVDCEHARLVRIDNFEPRDVITIGADKWRLYPWWRKSLVGRDGGFAITNSGTMGWAIRFDGVP